MENLQVLMASWPDEDDLVAELWRGDSYIGDMRKRDSRLIVTLSPAGGRADDIEVDDLLEALARARDRLLSPP